MAKDERVEHPSHYQRLWRKYGIEAWDICQEYGFLRGNALKYLLRAGCKAEQGYSQVEKTIEDLEKAKQYIDKEIETLRTEKENHESLWFNMPPVVTSDAHDSSFFKKPDPNAAIPV